MRTKTFQACINIQIFSLPFLGALMYLLFLFAFSLCLNDKRHNACGIWIVLPLKFCGNVTASNVWRKTRIGVACKSYIVSLRVGNKMWHMKNGMRAQTLHVTCINTVFLSARAIVSMHANKVYMHCTAETYLVKKLMQSNVISNELLCFDKKTNDF